MLLLPAPSVKVLAKTLMVAGVVLLLAGVKVAVKEEPDPDSVPRVPSVTVISLAIKSEAPSLSVKVMVAVSPDLRVLLSEVIVTVGAAVSTVMEIVLEAVLVLPAPSVKVLAATLMVAGVVLLLVGVKLAV